MGRGGPCREEEENTEEGGGEEWTTVSREERGRDKGQRARGKGGRQELSREERERRAALTALLATEGFRIWPPGECRATSMWPSLAITLHPSCSQARACLVVSWPASRCPGWQGWHAARPSVSRPPPPAAFLERPGNALLNN